MQIKSLGAFLQSAYSALKPPPLYVQNIYNYGGTFISMSNHCKNQRNLLFSMWVVCSTLHCKGNRKSYLGKEIAHTQCNGLQF